MRNSTSLDESRQHPLWLRLLPCLLLIAITAAAYLNADHEEFLLDSARPEFLAEPARDLAGTLREFRQDPLRPGGQVTSLSFALNYLANRAIGLDGLDVTGFLAMNVLIHAVNACLVYFLLRALLGLINPRGPAPILIPAVLAVLFAVHPIHASSVVYILHRSGVLATLFYLLGVLAWLGARRAAGFAKAGDDRQRTSHSTSGAEARSLLRFVVYVLLLLACYWLAYRSKPIAMTLPFTILLIELALRAGRWSLGRLTASVLVGTAVYAIVIITGASAVGRLDPSLGFGAMLQHADWGFSAHVSTMGRVIAQYWKLLLLPLPGWMCIDHDFAISHGCADAGAIASISLHIVLVVLAVLAIRRGHALIGLGLLWFYLVQIPYVLLPQRELLVEYRAYLPSVGLLLIGAGMLVSIRGLLQMRLAVVGLGLIAAVLMILTIRGNAVYQSSYHLWADALAKSPTNVRAAAGLADALLKAGRLEEAVEQLKAVVAMTESDDSFTGRASHFAALNNLGDALMKSNRPGEAAERFVSAARLDPDNPTVLYNLGFALAQIGKHNEAMQCLEKSLRSAPKHADTHFQLANSCVMEGKLTKAEKHYRQVIQLEPQRAIAHSHLAKVLMMQRKPGEALACFERVLQLAPESAEAHKSFGDVLHQLGRADEAIARYQRAIEIDPGYAEACNNLANVLTLAGGRDAEALELYLRSVKANPDYLLARENMADLLVRLGRPGEAVAEYEEVLATATPPQIERVRGKLIAATQPTSP